MRRHPVPLPGVAVLPASRFAYIEVAASALTYPA